MIILRGNKSSDRTFATLVSVWICVDLRGRESLGENGGRGETCCRLGLSSDGELRLVSLAGRLLTAMGHRETDISSSTRRRCRQAAGKIFEDRDNIFRNFR